MSKKIFETCHVSRKRRLGVAGAGSSPRLTVGIFHEVQGVAQQRQPVGARDLAGQLVEVLAAHAEVDVPQGDGRRQQVEEQIERRQREQRVHALNAGRHVKSVAYVCDNIITTVFDTTEVMFNRERERIRSRIIFF